MTDTHAPRIGHDLVDIPRFAAKLARRPHAWRRRVFTEAEWEGVSHRPDRDAALAVRFAAKEATLKALGTGWGGGVGWQDVEVLGGGRRPPRLVLHGRALHLAAEAGLTFQVSLSHAGDTASAMVLAVRSPHGDGSGDTP